MRGNNVEVKAGTGAGARTEVKAGHGGLTFLTKHALVVGVSALADGPAVSGDAYASMLTRVVRFARVRTVADFQDLRQKTTRLT